MNTNIFAGFCLIALTMMILVDARLRENNTAEFFTSCDDSAMYVRMTFMFNFKGSIFVPGHYFDPTCSYGVIPTVRLKEINITLPHNACEMTILNSSNKLIGFNTLSISPHVMLDSEYDYEQNVTCELKNPIKDLNKNIFIRPSLRTWISFQNPSSVLSEELMERMDLDEELLLIYNVVDRGMYRDMVVKNCIGHDSKTANNRTRFSKISDPLGCSPTNVTSNFTVVRDPNNNAHMLAFAVLKNFTMDVRSKFFVTCGAEFCKNTCERNCGQIDLTRGFSISDVKTKSIGRRKASEKPASLAALDRNDRQRRSNTETSTYESDAFLLEKINMISPIPVNQSHTEASTVLEINQESTQSSSDLEHIRSKRAIKEVENFLPTEVNVVLIESGDEMTSEIKPLTIENKNLPSETSPDSCENNSVLKIKMTFKLQHSSQIDEQKAQKFKFNFFLRALVAAFALISVSAACYCLFSRRNMNSLFIADYAL